MKLAVKLLKYNMVYFSRYSHFQLQLQQLCVNLLNKQTKFSSPLTQEVILDPLNELLGFVFVPLKGAHGDVESVLQVFSQIFGFHGRLLGIHDLARQTLLAATSSSLIRHPGAVTPALFMDSSSLDGSGRS